MGAVGNSIRDMSPWILLDHRHYYTAMKTSEHLQIIAITSADEV